EQFNYMKYLTLILSFSIIAGCSGNKAIKIKKKSHPSHIYNYMDIDRDSLNYLETDYVPVYSDIYFQDGTRRFHLTITISIRNTSLVDSAFILSALYYDSYGKMLTQYVDSTLLLSPLESIEFVVEEIEELGGPGANFIVEWGAKNYSNQILIQSIMIGTYGQQGVSFISEAKVISSDFKE
ncbi:MAG: DUF3124 domain-containing protein, partial [Prolixibacteraceae bacterium]|nr:DUF3124 domain-containing protein [Prolixibacteraceae bacterium]